VLQEKKISRKDFLFQSADELAPEYVAPRQRSNAVFLNLFDDTSHLCSFEVENALLIYAKI
jgi:hypothetical protein